MPRILFVSMQNVTHAAQWVGQLKSTDWDVHFFPSHEKASYLHIFENATIYSKEKFVYPARNANVRVRSLMPISHYRTARIAQRVFKRYFDSARWLAKTIDRLRPDLIHSMEMQHGAYLIDEALKYLKGPLPPWIVTPWGSDLYLYRHLSAHAGKLRSVLGRCDYFWAECRRDYTFAAELGFKGKSLEAVPASGGYPSKQFLSLEAAKPSERKIIMLKGYQGFVGRALSALAAMRQCAEELRGYRLVIYLSCYEVNVAAELLSKAIGIPVEILEFPRPYEEIQSYFARSRVHLGMSISDGMPTSVIESMAMGTFPVQSDSCCAHEWIEDGVTGFLVPADDPHAIARALRRALTEDDLVDRAAERNRQVVLGRFDYDTIRDKVLRIYDSLTPGPRGS